MFVELPIIQPFTYSKLEGKGIRWFSVRRIAMLTASFKEAKIDPTGSLTNTSDDSIQKQMLQ